MDQAPENQTNKPRRVKVNTLVKSLVVVLAAAGIFAAGVAVGRGNINVRGLSANRFAASQQPFDYASVNQIYAILQSDFDGNLDNAKLLDGIKSGLVSAAGDPYTEYFNASQAKDFNNQLSGTFTGIGAELGSDADNNIVIVAPLAGYPAQSAGLQPKDVIAAVDGQSTAGLSIDSVVNKIRGPAGTVVKLTIIRGAGKPFDVSITRAKISVPSVKYQVDGQIGYLKISQFGNDTVELAQQAAANFKAKGVKAVVLDLRGDPGGYLDDAVDISSMWLPKGKTIVSERRGSTILSTKYSNGSGEFAGLPTVVLIDGGSASASEITAGALSDNGVATLLGTKSFGKGSVQEVEQLAGGTELKVTIARWYTPDGKNIDKQGITPQTVVPVSDADQKAGNDPQKTRAYQILQSKL